MKELVKEIIKKIKNTNSQEYTVEKLEELCSPSHIPKEFNSTENSDEIKDELKAFTLGCELFFEIKQEKYNGDNQAIKEAGVYQFLQATLQDEVSSIISDTDYLKNLLELYGRDREEFDIKMENGSVIDKYSTVGLIRDINQDSLRVSPTGDILIVADGVGGGEHGEIASQKASDSVFNSLHNRYENKDDISKETILQDLKNAIMEANRVVIDYAKTNSINTIGTTLSVALIYNQKLFFGHVGDSRIYRIGKNQEPKLITQDHSLPEVLCRNKEIEEAEKENYKKNILVYVVGKKDLKEKNLHIGYEEEELTNDTLFLCSDGVWDIDKNIEDKFTSKAEDLKRFILENTPSDNATFIRCKFDYKKTLDVLDNVETKNNKKKKRGFALIGAGLIGLASLLYMLSPNKNIKIEKNTTASNTVSIPTPLPTLTLNTPIPTSYIPTPAITIDNNLTDNSRGLSTQINKNKTPKIKPSRVVKLKSQKKKKLRRNIVSKKIVLKRKRVIAIQSTIPKIKYWKDSDRLFLGKDWVATFKKDRITLEVGFCKLENGKWVCIIPKYKIRRFVNLTKSKRLKHQKFAKEVFLNIKKSNSSNSNVRIVITPKEGYKVLKKRVHGKQVLVFKKK